MDAVFCVTRSSDTEISRLIALMSFLELLANSKLAVRLRIVRAPDVLALPAEAMHKVLSMTSGVRFAGELAAFPRDFEGERVLVSDDATVFHPRALEGMLEALEAWPSVLVTPLDSESRYRGTPPLVVDGAEIAGVVRATSTRHWKLTIPKSKAVWMGNRGTVEAHVAPIFDLAPSGETLFCMLAETVECVCAIPCLATSALDPSACRAPCLTALPTMRAVEALLLESCGPAGSALAPVAAATSARASPPAATRH